MGYWSNTHHILRSLHHTASHWLYFCMQTLKRKRKEMMAHRDQSLQEILEISFGVLKSHYLGAFGQQLQSAASWQAAEAALFGIRSSLSLSAFQSPGFPCSFRITHPTLPTHFFIATVWMCTGIHVVQHISCSWHCFLPLTRGCCRVYNELLFPQGLKAQCLCLADVSASTSILAGVQ